MNMESHERARMIIALSDAVSGADQTWLAAHLESCASCREFADSTGETIRSLRAMPVMASAGLVSTTQARVRQRAQELRRRRERLHVILVCSAAVTLCTAVSTALLWRGFAWLSEWAGQQLGQQWMSQAGMSAIWEIGFVALCLMPTIVAGVVLLARGTYMADHNGTFQG